MRYILKRKEPLSVGDTRVISKFLILPLILNGELRWLERVSILQETVKFVDMSCGYSEILWQDMIFFNCYDCMECNYKYDKKCCKRR